AMQAAVQITTSVARNWRIWFILASLCFTTSIYADNPPADLIRRIGARETETVEAQANYTYRQTVTIEEINHHGMQGGSYHEVRDVIFSPKQERTEQMVGRSSDTLHNLKLTEEDFRDIREIQPFLLTKNQMFLHET